MPHGVSSKSLTLGRHRKNIQNTEKIQKIQKFKKRTQKRMASEQAIANETIAKVVAEMTPAAMQAMAAAAAERPHSKAELPR